MRRRSVLAGAVAAVTVLYLKGDVTPAAVGLPVGPPLVAELLYTFALVFVVLNVATAPGNRGVADQAGLEAAGSTE